MAPKYSKSIGIVLKKTKLSESDLIISLIGQDGSKLQAVAKGARKPQNSNSSRLELFSEVELLLNESKSLPIISDVSLLNSCTKSSELVEHNACANLIAELLCKICHEDLEHPRLFKLMQAYLEKLSYCENDQQIYLLACASSLKIFAMTGFKPALDSCVYCGELLQESGSVGEYLNFSFAEGGVLCSHCANEIESLYYLSNDISWLHALLMTNFAKIMEMEIDTDTLRRLFSFCDNWSKLHLGIKINTFSYINSFLVTNSGTVE